MTEKVFIQGIRGSFHHQAAELFFAEKVEIIPCATFGEVINKAIAESAESRALIAIENSIAGSISHNYDLIKDSSLFVSGEIFLTIKMNLLGYPGTRKSDIKEVYSHQIGLMQCTDYLEKHPDWKRIELSDTAFSARFVHQQKNKSKAAIAGELASTIYGLEIIERNIQSQFFNFTRFLILEKHSQKQNPDEADKSSIYFQLGSGRKSLANPLSLIESHGAHSTKVQSFPIGNTAWEYGFYVDIEHKNPDQIETMMKELSKQTQDFKVLGHYKKGLIF